MKTKIRMNFYTQIKIIKRVMKHCIPMTIKKANINLVNIYIKYN